MPSKLPELVVGDKVTYAKIRETQGVQPDRRNATYVVEEFATNSENEAIVKVRTPWETSHWIRRGWLEKVSEKSDADQTA
jgi:hypothetical protein